MMQLLIEAFLKDAKRISDALKKFLSKKEGYTKKDLKDYVTYVHGIKSAAHNVGEQELSEYAKSLENASGTTDMDTILIQTAILIEKVDEVVEKFSAIIYEERIQN